MWPGIREAQLGAAFRITTLDLSWRAIYADGQPGDGFIPASRQTAPISGATEYKVDDADSHVGATKGKDRGIKAIRDNLAVEFDVPVR